MLPLRNSYKGRVMVETNISELFETLHESSTKFIVDSIDQDKYKKCYLLEFDAVRKVYEESTTFLGFKRSLLYKKDKVSNLKENLFHKYFTDYKKHQVLAYTNAIDIIDSLVTRFINGGESVYYTGGIKIND